MKMFAARVQFSVCGTHLHVIIAKDDRVAIMRLNEVHDACRNKTLRDVASG